MNTNMKRFLQMLEVDYKDSGFKPAQVEFSYFFPIHLISALDLSLVLETLFALVVVLEELSK